MALRDLLVFAAVFATLPFVLLRPWIGVLLWVWISVMNPHRLTWGAAYDFPFGQFVAAFTLAGLVFTPRTDSFERWRTCSGAAPVRGMDMHHYLFCA